jgi:hypothetical protein
MTDMNDDGDELGIPSNPDGEVMGLDSALSELAGEIDSGSERQLEAAQAVAKAANERPATVADQAPAVVEALDDALTAAEGQPKALDMDEVGNQRLAETIEQLVQAVVALAPEPDAQDVIVPLAKEWLSSGEDYFLELGVRVGEAVLERERVPPDFLQELILGLAPFMNLNHDGLIGRMQNVVDDATQAVDSPYSGGHLEDRDLFDREVLGDPYRLYESLIDRLMAYLESDRRSAVGDAHTMFAALCFADSEDTLPPQRFLFDHLDRVIESAADNPWLPWDHPLIAAFSVGHALGYWFTADDERMEKVGATHDLSDERTFREGVSTLVRVARTTKDALRFKDENAADIESGQDIGTTGSSQDGVITRSSQDVATTFSEVVADICEEHPDLVASEFETVAEFLAVQDQEGLDLMIDALKTATTENTDVFAAHADDIAGVLDGTALASTQTIATVTLMIVARDRPDALVPHAGRMARTALTTEEEFVREEALWTLSAVFNHNATALDGNEATVRAALAEIEEPPEWAADLEAALLDESDSSRVYSSGEDRDDGRGTSDSTVGSWTDTEEHRVIGGGPRTGRNRSGVDGSHSTTGEEQGDVDQGQGVAGRDRGGAGGDTDEGQEVVESDDEGEVNAMADPEEAVAGVTAVDDPAEGVAALREALAERSDDEGDGESAVPAALAALAAVVTTDDAAAVDVDPVLDALEVVTDETPIERGLSVLRTVSVDQPGAVGDRADVVVDLLNHEEPTIRGGAMEVLARVVDDDPDAVTPHADAIAGALPAMPDQRSLGYGLGMLQRLAAAGEYDSVAEHAGTVADILPSCEDERIAVFGLSVFSELADERPEAVVPHLETITGTGQRVGGDAVTVIVGTMLKLGEAEEDLLAGREAVTFDMLQIALDRGEATEISPDAFLLRFADVAMDAPETAAEYTDALLDLMAATDTPATVALGLRTLETLTEEEAAVGTIAKRADEVLDAVEHVHLTDMTGISTATGDEPDVEIALAEGVSAGLRALVDATEHAPETMAEHFDAVADLLPHFGADPRADSILFLLQITGALRRKSLADRVDDLADGLRRLTDEYPGATDKAVQALSLVAKDEPEALIPHVEVIVNALPTLIDVDNEIPVERRQIDTGAVASAVQTLVRVAAVESDAVLPHAESIGGAIGRCENPGPALEALVSNHWTSTEVKTIVVTALTTVCETVTGEGRTDERTVLLVQSMFVRVLDGAEPSAAAGKAMDTVGRLQPVVTPK